MFLQTIPEKRSGRVLMTFVESYQDKETRRIRQRTVETIGYVDEFEHLYPDVKAHFKSLPSGRPGVLKPIDDRLSAFK